MVIVLGLGILLQNGLSEMARHFACNFLDLQDLEWSHPPGSNRRPADYESAALPAELGWPAFILINLRAMPPRSWIQLDSIGPPPDRLPVLILADGRAIRQLRARSPGQI